MKNNLRIWAAVAVLAFYGSTAAFAGEADGTIAITPVFSQLVAYHLPKGFVGAFEDSKSASYVQESVPTGETVYNWSAMITLTGRKDGATEGDDPLERMAGSFHSRFQTACPESVTAISFGRYAIDGRPSMGLFLGCGRVETSQGMVSETAVIMIIQGERDIYSLQWATHDTPQDAPPEFVAATWKPRIDQLAPLR
eukprot:gene41456-56084_t